MIRRLSARATRDAAPQTVRDAASKTVLSTAVPSTAGRVSTALMVIVLVAIAVLLAACGVDDAGASADGADEGVVVGAQEDDGGAAAVGAPSPVVGTWVLVAGEDADGTLPTADAAVTLTIGDSQISGDAGCNSYSSAASIADGAISVDAVAATRMACQPTAVMSQEAAYLSALGQVDRITKADDGRLVLTGPDISLSFQAS